jgi:D-serine dehydratase
MTTTESLRNRPILPTEKGFGIIAAGQADVVSAATISARHLDALGPEFTMPLAILRDSALEHNASAMATWCADAGVLLAPHGKTTMAPQLMARQLAAGAWAITAATISQVRVYRAFGIERILLANELTDRAGISWLAAELNADPDWECYAYVDSLDGVELLDAGLRAAGARRPLHVLVEFGFRGGRTGCRSVPEAQAVAAAAVRAPTLLLAGASGYEGGLGRDASQATLDAVAAYCADLLALARQLPGEPPAISRPPAADQAASHPAETWIVSAGGSAYFDVVARVLTASDPSGPPLTVVLRSGCYLTHDHGTYTEIGPGVQRGGPELVPAMEVWASVLSCPEPGLALACAGRRDVSFDLGFPVPLQLRRADGTLLDASECEVTRLDDQHAYLRLPGGPDGLSPRPGDLVRFGISHPCTTFDKWRVIPVVDDDYHVIDVVHTFF